jgi:ATP-dependent RNA helicase DOB1
VSIPIRLFFCVVQGKPLDSTTPPQSHYIVDVLLHVATDSAPNPKGGNKRGEHATVPLGMEPAPEGAKGEFVVAPVLLSTLDGISHIRIFLPKDLKPADARAQAFKALEEVKRRFPEGIGLLDPVENMGVQDDAFKQLLQVRPP